MFRLMNLTWNNFKILANKHARYEVWNAYEDMQFHNYKHVIH